MTIGGERVQPICSAVAQALMEFSSVIDRSSWVLGVASGVELLMGGAGVGRFSG